MDIKEIDIKEYEKRQRKLLLEFDKKLFEYTGKLAWFMNGIGIFMTLCTIMLPVQDVLHNMQFMIISALVSGFISVQLYMMPYTNAKDALDKQDKECNVYKRIKYTPVSKKMYVKLRMSYLNKRQIKLTIAGLVIQSGMAIGSIDTFGIENILYVVFVVYVIPMIYCLVHLKATN